MSLAIETNAAVPISRGDLRGASGRMSRNRRDVGAKEARPLQTHGKVFSGILALALGLGVTGPAWALELPGQKWSQRCQRCGKALTGASIPAPPPPNWPSNSGMAYPGRCCPPSPSCPPATGPAMPGMPGMDPERGRCPRRCLPLTGQPEARPRLRRRPPPPRRPPLPPRPLRRRPPLRCGPSPVARCGRARATGPGLGPGRGPRRAEWRIGDVRRHRTLRPPGRHRAARDTGNSPVAADPPAESGDRLPRNPFGIDPTNLENPRNKSAILVPSVRGFKIADNQTPMPVNRISYGFNYFNDVNEAINRRFGYPDHRDPGLLPQLRPREDDPGPDGLDRVENPPEYPHGR